jgi:anti-sigma regulatory factor (Ser/Thr protein kinase)/ActR/RegA family two-component response regulator
MNTSETALAPSFSAVMVYEQQSREARVLVCCCDEEAAKRITDVLCDCRIERFSSKASLLAAIEASPAALVVTGEGTSGTEAVDILRDILSVRAGTRVILQPKHSAQAEVIAAIREGVFSYFSRPYFDAAFGEILRHAVSGDPWEDSISVNSATPAWLRMMARCELSTADRVIQFMNELSDLDGKDRESMGFVLKEILMNAMEYGGQFNRDRLVEISYVRGRRMVLYRVRDPGEGFSLLELPHAAISNPPEEPVRHLEVRDSKGMRPGGYGVLLSRKLVDDLIYSEQGNDVLIIKYLDPPASESVDAE